ncbi:MAG: ATP-dependent Clp protease adapter ClpS [Thermodesulfovibrionales bacterium]
MQKHGLDPDIREKTGQQTKLPPQYRVLLLNDDYTTMDFVVFVLREVFGKSLVEATQIMLHVHRKGSGTAGVFTRDIAETKIDTVHRLARDNGYPLRCGMEKA